MWILLIIPTVAAIYLLIGIATLAYYAEMGPSDPILRRWIDIILRWPKYTEH